MYFEMFLFMNNLFMKMTFFSYIRSALLEQMPLIESSRSKNVLSDSNSSEDLLNTGRQEEVQRTNIENSKQISQSTEVNSTGKLQ